MWYYYFLGVLLIPGLIMSIRAQIKTSRAFEENNKRTTRSVKTASELARYYLDREELSHIKLNRCKGELTDHYNPTKETISLSDSVHDNRSISAIGVMAHEVGHALQYRDNYFPIKLRMILVPIINFASFFMWPLTIFGLMLEFLAYTQIGFTLICIGIGIFALSTFFALITVPVERDASRRAYNMLISSGLINEDEGEGVKEVLDAAGQTYIASLVTSILSLLRFVLFVFTVRNRD